MARGLITSLIAGLGAPLATALANRFIVAPYLEEQKQREMVDYPVEARQKQMDLVGSVLQKPEFSGIQSPEQMYSNPTFINTMAAAQGGPEKYAPLLSGYGGGYGNVAVAQPTAQKIQSMTPAEVGLTQAHAGYFQQAGQKEAAQAKATTDLIEANRQKLMADAFHATGLGNLAGAQAKDFINNVAANQNVKNAQADLFRAQGKALATGDKSELVKTMGTMAQHIFPEIQKNYMTYGNMGREKGNELTQEQLSQKAREDAMSFVTNFVSGMGTMRQSLANGQPIAQPAAPNVAGDKWWLR
jgi:hypothetical protein